jgi:hypothetical protein
MYDTEEEERPVAVEEPWAKMTCAPMQDVINAWLIPRHRSAMLKRAAHLAAGISLSDEKQRLLRLAESCHLVPVEKTAYPSEKMKIPRDVVYVRQYTPPISLGPFASYIMNFCEFLVQHYMVACAASESSAEPTTDSSHHVISIHGVEDIKTAIEEYSERCERYAALVGYERPFTKSQLIAEQEHWMQWLAPRNGLKGCDAASRSCAEFLQFAEGQLTLRADFMTAWTVSYLSRLATATLPMAFELSDCYSALKALIGGLAPDPEERTAAPFKPDGALHAALMEIAMSQFRCRNPNITLEWIRDLLLIHRTASKQQFASFLLTHALIGL